MCYIQNGKGMEITGSVSLKIKSIRKNLLKVKFFQPSDKEHMTFQKSNGIQKGALFWLKHLCLPVILSPLVLYSFPGFSPQNPFPVSCFQGSKMGQISRKLKIFILRQLYSEKYKFQSSWSSHVVIFSFIKERGKEDRETEEVLRSRTVKS